MFDHIQSFPEFNLHYDQWYEVKPVVILNICLSHIDDIILINFYGASIYLSRGDSQLLQEKKLVNLMLGKKNWLY